MKYIIISIMYLKCNLLGLSVIYLLGLYHFLYC